MEEVWKDIYFIENGIEYDFTGLYEVSNLGRIRSLNYGTTGKSEVLKPTPTKLGYLDIRLSKNGKTKHFYIHQLVARAFLENDNPEVKIEVNHKNENKEDNRAENLEWCDRKYNVQYSLNKKVICVETRQIFDSIKEACEWLDIDYDISHSNISKCCNGKQKTAYGYHWKYVDTEEE